MPDHPHRKGRGQGQADHPRKPNEITRREFLDGAATTAAALAVSLSAAQRAAGHSAAAPAGPAPYPPALTGLRGSHPGSFEVAHTLRDGDFWESAGSPADTGEMYDLVVVGAGLSGLTAATLFRDHGGAGCRVLLLDNHDDFGGHARRNEFKVGNRTLIGYGGSYAIDSPAPYSAFARSLVSRLGIDVSRGDQCLDRTTYGRLGLGRRIFLDRETFGRDALLVDPLGDFGGEADDVTAPGTDLWKSFREGAPLTAEVSASYESLCTRPVDPWPGLTSAEKKLRMARLSYADFLLGHARVHPTVTTLLRARTHSLYGVGIDAVAAQDAWGLGLPGFKGMALDATASPGMNHDVVPHPEKTPYFFHFPDGNGTLARLLVRELIPGAVPGSTVDDSVTARVNYSALDRAGAPTRLRLSSTVVRVKHHPNLEHATGVDVDYVANGTLRRVRAGHVVLACWHAVIPHLCPEIPDAQGIALADAVKVPLVYTNVLIRQWEAFRKLGASAVHCPGAYHSTVNLGRMVHVGQHRSPVDPSEPMVLHMVRTPCSPGLPARQQHKMGRVELLSTSAVQIEEATKDQLDRMLGSAGFDSRRDLLAITINRWSHGYPYQYNSLWDPYWMDGGPLPCERARRPFGRVTIANADAGAYSYADSAFDQAHRAIKELIEAKG